MNHINIEEMFPILPLTPALDFRTTYTFKTIQRADFCVKLYPVKIAPEGHSLRP
jgi:hypothetical protein